MKKIVSAEEAGKMIRENCSLMVGGFLRCGTPVKVIEEIIKFTQSYGFYLKGLSVSPITGTKGNIEYISHFINEEIYDTIKLDEIIEQARVLREENK